MVKKAQIRFIAVTMAILFAVFAVIFGVLWGIMGENFSREIQMSLSDAEKGYDAENGYNDNSPVRFGKAVAVMKISSDNVTIIDGDSFPTETLYNVAEAAKANVTADKGNYGDLYYKKRPNGAATLVFVADMSFEAARFHSSLIKTLILLLSILVALFIVVWGLSAKVFEPIKYILAKQKQFISDASHELKTPVSIISANADVVRTDENGAYVDSIKNQVERLKFLVNDMLTLARLDEGSLSSITEKFNLSDEVTQTVLPFDAVAFEKGKTLDCDVEPDVFYEGDRHGVKQIINILLDNAVKYAADGGRISVSLKKIGVKTELSVYNDGSMIKDEDAQKIFERFYRGDDSRSRESGGNGLGLSIAKGIAVANKWQLYAVSVFGKSMTITLTL